MNHHRIAIALFAIMTSTIPAGATTLANTFDAENNPDVAYARPDVPGATGHYLVVWSLYHGCSDPDIHATLLP